MRRTRMYVANVNNPTLVWGNLLDFEPALGYHESKGHGYFEGVREPDTVVEILGGTRARVGQLANLLALYAHNQGEDSIMVTIEDGDGTLDAYLLEGNSEGGVRWIRLS